ncbi:hypothetical protein ACFYOV_28730 [Streptomyces sp. NPDC005931]|uniref:hypothetical protein n=1 Tax=Streptomyces sp. NPDC005931 TaxID=3364737 RepID=UPI0036744FB9
MNREPRLEYVAGAWLPAQDLRDAPRLPRRRLAQHHLAAHRTWGCAAGLEVRAGRGEVTVGPGCAVDRCGRIGVLDHQVTRPVPPGEERVVVLALRAFGPAADVRLRRPADVRDLDVPLALLTADGTQYDGDGVRRWTRRPGPARRLGGLVPRGSPVEGTAAAWSARVDLAADRLAATPAVTAGFAGPAPGLATVEVHDTSPTGFTLTVRHYDPPGTAAPADPATVHAAPAPLSWLALLPAARPRPAHPQE